MGIMDCYLCERGFPFVDPPNGHPIHCGTQNLGMIPNTPCQRPKLADGTFGPPENQAHHLRVARRRLEEVRLRFENLFTLWAATPSAQWVEIIQAFEDVKAAKKELHDAIANYS